MPQTATSISRRAPRPRSRLGFRVDAETKRLVERAAALERRSLTDFCLSALTEATRATITRHQSLVLSERDRAAFFDALVHPPKPNPRLRRAFAGASSGSSPDGRAGEPSICLSRSASIMTGPDFTAASKALIST